MSVEFHGVPRAPRHATPRPRLVERIENGEALVVLSAPAGFGKTAAVVDWVNAQHGTPGLWITMADRHDGSEALWQVILDKVFELGAEATKRSDSDRHDLNASPTTPLEISRALLFSTRLLTVVVDGLNQIDETTVAGLVWLLQQNEELRIIITTSTSPELFRCAEVAADMTMIARDELAFDRGEIAELATEFDVAIPGDFASRIHEATAGVAVTVRAAVIAAREGRITPLSTDSAFASAVGAALQPIFMSANTGAFSRELREFAEAVALPESVSHELATRLTGRDDAGALLDQLYAAGIGKWAAASRGREFQYVPLIRALLLEKAPANPSDLRDRKRELARWHAENADIIRGLQVALEVDDLELASELLRFSWFDQDSMEQMLRFARVFETVPLRRLSRYPLLLMAMAINYNSTGTHRLRAMELFGLAAVAAKLRGSRAHPSERLLLAASESAADRLRGRFKHAEQSALKARGFVDSLDPADREELGGVFGIAMNHVGISLLRTGHTHAARDIFSSVRSSPTASGPRSRVHASALLSGALAIEGDIVSAEKILREDDDNRWPEHLRGGYVGALRRLASAIIALERFDLDLARSELKSMEPHISTIEHWGEFAWAQAWLDMSSGDAGVGAERLALTLADSTLPPIAAYLRTRLTGTLALMRLAAGRPEEVLGQGDTALHPSIAVALAVRELQNDNPVAALRAIEQTGGAQLAHRDRAQFHVVAATAMMRSGRRAAAAARLDALAAVMRQTGMGLHLLLTPRDDLQLLGELARESGSGGTARALSRIQDPPDIWPKVVELPQLSRRETEVLAELATTATLNQIAQKHFVSPNTIKAQVFSIYRKLNVGSRSEAVNVAQQRGLVDGAGFRIDSDHG